MSERDAHHLSGGSELSGNAIEADKRVNEAECSQPEDRLRGAAASPWAMSWRGLLKLFLFLAPAAARAVAVRGRTAREREERERRERANQRSRLLSLPGDVLGIIFTHLDTQSQKALLSTSRAVRSMPQLLEQLAPVVMLRDVAREPAGEVKQLLPAGLASHCHSGTLQRLVLVGELVKRDVPQLMHFLKRAQAGRAWHELQGLGELRIKNVWEDPRAASGSEQRSPCSRQSNELPSLHTLCLRRSSCPTFVQALAETQAGQQLHTLALDLSYPDDARMDASFDVMSFDARFCASGLLRKYVPVIAQLRSLQVLHIRCMPAMLKGVSFAQLGSMKSLKHLSLCVNPFSAFEDDQRALDHIEFQYGDGLFLQSVTQDLRYLRLETLELYISDYLRTRVVPFLQPPLSTTLQKFVCDNLCLLDLPELYELPAIQVIQVSSIGIVCSRWQATSMATRTRMSRRFQQVQLILSSRQTESAHTSGDDRPFTLHCSCSRRLHYPHPLSLMHFVLSAFIGTPGLTRVTALCLKQVDLTQEDELHSLADLFPNLTRLYLSSPVTRVHYSDASRYCGWCIAVLRLRLEMLETDMPCSFSHGHERRVEEVRWMNEAILAACASAQQQGRCLVFVLGNMYPTLARQVDACWRQQFANTSLEGQGISCELELFEDMCLGVRARLVFSARQPNASHAR